MHLIFEQTASKLYYSNDGRLRAEEIAAQDNETGFNITVLKLDGVEVFCTRDRVAADAYIAGYDAALGRSDLLS